MTTDTIVESHSIGDSLDLASPWIAASLVVELPFWLQVPSGQTVIELAGHGYPVKIDDSYVEVFAREMTDSRATCAYQGPPDGAGKGAALAQVALAGYSVLPRKCKTVLRITSPCPSDVIAAAREGGARARAADWFYIAFVSAHLPVVNRLIRSYRLASNDPSAYEVSPWDVPVWFCRSEQPGEGWRVSILPEAEWDRRRGIKNFADRDNPQVPFTVVHLTDLPTLETMLKEEISPAESALLDADNLIHRGDYSGAVRRIVTALEVLVETKLRGELLKAHSPTETERLLNGRQLRNNFKARLEEYERLSNRQLDQSRRDFLDRTRKLRHEIVHEGRRVSYGERGLAAQCVDIGRFTFSWLEDDASKAARRNSGVASRNAGKHVVFFNTTLGPDGVTVVRT